MASTTARDAERTAADLCLDCGLCCNGVLFDQVMLLPGDHPKALAAAGLKIKKGDRFYQPCAALCGTLCGIYRHRPSRCRLFSCRQYRLVEEGAATVEEAADCIRESRERVDNVEKLLEAAGNLSARKPLAQRYATAIMRAEAGTDADPGEPSLLPELKEAMDQLQHFLTRHFRLP